MNNWYLTFPGVKDKQLLYSIDKPIYTFPVKEEKRGGKTILIPNRQAVWKPINLEIPTRMLPETEKWLNNKPKINVVATYVDQNGRTIEEWIMNGVEVVNSILKRGRMIDIPVRLVTIRIAWARRHL